MEKILDQMVGYFVPLRKTIRWYHTAVFDMLLKTNVVNAWINVAKYTLQIRKFREQLIFGLVEVNSRIQNIGKPKLVQKKDFIKG